jgi:hypothetical protein
MKIKHIAALGAISILAACNQAVDSENQAGTPDEHISESKKETSTNGIITKGLTEFEMNAAPLAKSTSTPWIGLIPAGDPVTQACPDGYSSLRFDDEDNSNRNNFWVNGQDYSGRNYSLGGLAHSSSPSRAGGNSTIKYCNKQVSSLPVLNHDYAVISASNVCPANSIRFFKRWDNEDGSNHNASTGDITPGWSSVSGSASGMYFCFVPSGSGSSWNSMFNNYFLFTRATLSNYASFYGDDEDDGNNNGYSSDNSNYTTRMQQLISGGSNTTLRIATSGPAVSLDGGTNSGCSDFQWKIGVKCDFGSDGVRNCKPMGGVEDYWAVAKQLVCYY